jgi:hypothetical protein
MKERCMNRREVIAAAGMIPVIAYAAPGGTKTSISIKADEFYVNNFPSYPGRVFRGKKIQGLLLNSRMVQGIFDDKNPATCGRWAYPDTGVWDAERNTNEFIAAMPLWRAHGVLSFTVNLQGGSPEGYSKTQPWETGAIAPDGSLRPDFMRRLKKILDRADTLGMVPIVGIFYFGQDNRIADEAAVKKAVRNATLWILSHGYHNVLLEIANECDIPAYDHDIIKPARIHELIEIAKKIRVGSRRLLTGVSFGGGTLPNQKVVEASDYLLLHGNGVADPAKIASMVQQTRRLAGYRPMPIMFNEDDHFDFDQPINNLVAALGEYASWGYFDPGISNYSDGYQCPPINWGLNTTRKLDFFKFAKDVAGT